MRRARWKRKHVRRVGLRRRSPPAAGGGRLAVPCGSQRRKRAALGETSSPGRYRDTPLPLSPLPLTFPRRTRQRLAKRKARKEKLVECILAPRRCRHHPPRDSSHDLAEDDSVPEGKPKSALVPIRRPRQDRGANAPACAKSGLFFWTGRGPFSFRQDRKENGGRIAQPSSWLNPPGRQIAAPAAPPEESPLSGGGEAKKAAGPPASRPTVCLYAKNPLRIRSSASSSVRPRVSSFSSWSPAILPMAAS